jgi:hypothetical protein
MRLLACSDAVAAHGFKGGSLSLGGLVEYADRQLLPIAIFHYEHTRISRKLAGFEPSPIDELTLMLLMADVRA